MYWEICLKKWKFAFFIDKKFIDDDLSTLLIWWFYNNTKSVGWGKSLDELIKGRFYG